MIKIFQIDDNSRIKVSDGNYVLQYKSRSAKNKWVLGGYFGDLVSLGIDYINDAPISSCERIDDFKKLMQVIMEAEKRITKKLTNINI